MTTEHKPTDIKGYRPLDQQELARINRLKRTEEKLRDMCDELEAAVNEGSTRRWAALARTHLEIGMMFAIKAIARPDMSLGKNGRS
ncbi:MAG: hypothetical protein H6851_05215 [Geminicoccaceae bacterium]|nr:hypothetical protein [Geminicoccaceae bacterium]